MAGRSSRRAFLTGVLACGTLSAAAAYFLPTRAHVELTIAAGGDPDGVRQFLIDLWNSQHPFIRLRQEQVDLSRGARDERDALRSRAENGDADILLLDVVFIPEFIRDGLITEVPLDDELEFIDATLRPGLGDGPDRYFAVPFNSDVGLLFARRRSSPDRLPSLAEVIDRSGDRAAGPASGGTFVGQLTGGSNDPSTHEAFVVNVLEHLLARDPALLDEQTGMPVRGPRDLDSWREAILPLHEAMRRRSVSSAKTETESFGRFVRESDIEYMRNWPVWYGQLFRPPPDGLGTGASAISVGQLPTGVLGGASLAVVSGSRYRAEAMEVIRFFTSEPVQRYLASNSWAPVRRAAYQPDPGHLAVIEPGLLREAVESARPRPIHPRYLEFSDVIRAYFSRLLTTQPDTPVEAILTDSFLDDMNAALN